MATGQERSSIQRVSPSKPVMRYVQKTGWPAAERAHASPYTPRSENAMQDSQASDTDIPVGGGPPRCCSAPHAEKWLTTRAPCTSSHT